MLTHTILNEMEKHLHYRAESQDVVTNNLVDVAVPAGDMQDMIQAARIHLKDNGFNPEPPSLIDLVESILDEEDKDSLLRKIYNYIAPAHQGAQYNVNATEIYEIMRQHVENTNERQRLTKIERHLVETQ